MKRNKIICFVFSFILIIACLCYSADNKISRSNVRAASNGWVNTGGTWYYYENGSKLKDAWKLDSHGWCYLSAADGSWVQQGWAKDSRGWCYIQYGYWADYSMWAKDSRGWCHIENNGYWDGKPQVSEITEPLRFIVMADCRGEEDGTFNEEIVKETLEDIKKLSPQPSFAVMPGDLVKGKGTYSDNKKELANFKNEITKYYPVNFYYPGFGNHESAPGNEGEQAFGEIFSEFNASFLPGSDRTVYYFDRNNIRFFMLNSCSDNINNFIPDIQLNWIKQNNSGVQRSFYFFHSPAYPTGAHVGSSLDANRLQRDKLWQIIDSSIRPMVFCGHEHNYTRRHINSDFNETVNGISFKYSQTVYQVTTGTFGAPIYGDYKDSRDVDVPPTLKYHYAVVDVLGTGAIVTIYDINGNIIDQFKQ